MSVINNTLTEINDRITFTMGFPIVGVEEIEGYVEDVVGETETRFFKREIRYTLDGIHFTDWLPLDGTTIAEISIIPTDIFQAEFQYTRIGSDATGELVFNWVRLDYKTAVGCHSNYYFDLSIYKYFFDCPDHQSIRKWCINVFRKLYAPGIVPKFIERGVNRNRNREDQDYISFWLTVACYFSIIVNYARAFGNINSDPRLLKKYLQAKDVITEDTTLSALQEIASTTFVQFRRRGTFGIADASLNGELLRLVRYDKRLDEFIFQAGRYVWCLDWHSPMYRGINREQAFKAYSQKEVTPEELERYPLINPSAVSIVDESGESVLMITGVDEDTKAGIGFTDSSAVDLEDHKYLINIDPSLSYELSFFVRGDAPFTVGVYGYTAAITPAHPRCVNPANMSNYSIIRERVSRQSEWYWVRVIIHAQDETYSPDYNVARTSLGAGNNLRLSSVIRKLAFEITLDRTTGNTAPTVSNSQIFIPAGMSKTITVDDVLSNYNDVEGHSCIGITIVDLADENTGELVYNGDVIEEFPIFIPLQDIFYEKLFYRDTGPINGSYDAIMEYIVRDTQYNIESSQDSVLYLKGIRFKLLNRPYSVDVTNPIHFIETWMKNRSGLTDQQVEERMKSSLLPWNALNYNNFLE